MNFAIRICFDWIFHCFNFLNLTPLSLSLFLLFSPKPDASSDIEIVRLPIDSSVVLDSLCLCIETGLKSELGFSK